MASMSSNRMQEKLLHGRWPGATRAVELYFKTTPLTVLWALGSSSVQDDRSLAHHHQLHSQRSKQGLLTGRLPGLPFFGGDLGFEVGDEFFELGLLHRPELRGRFQVDRLL